MSQLLAIAAVLAIIFLVPLLVYGAASATGRVALPSEASPGRFLGGVFVTKLGTAVAFVLILQVSQAAWSGHWFAYGAIWFAMFAASEIGDGISKRSSWPESVLGIVSEALYAPTSALVASVILGIN